MAHYVCEFSTMDQKYCLNMSLVGSPDAKPRNTKGQLYIYWKKIMYKLIQVVQTRVIQGLTVVCSFISLRGIPLHEYNTLNTVDGYLSNF